MHKHIKAKKINIECQPKAAVKYPPSVGAIMGETPTTNIKEEKTFALSSTGKRSLTIARAATNPEQLPNACNNLSHIN